MIAGGSRDATKCEMMIDEAKAIIRVVVHRIQDTDPQAAEALDGASSLLSYAQVILPAGK